MKVGELLKIINKMDQDNYNTLRIIKDISDSFIDLVKENMIHDYEIIIKDKEESYKKTYYGGNL